MKKNMKHEGKCRRMMAAALLFITAQLCTSPAAAQTGSWRAYMSYSDVQQIVKGGQQLYVRASNDLYTYSLTDHSITTYDKVNALSDSYITHIAWSQAVNRLIITYQNSNIDLMDAQGNVVNMSALYMKSMTQDKTINRIDMAGQYAYLSCGFGIMKVDMKRCEVAESYILDRKITATGQDGTYLYARLANGSAIRGLLTDNLIDPHNWSAATAPEGIFAQDLTDYDQYIGTVSTLQPGGPHHNGFAFMRLKNGMLYTCGGGYYVTYDLERPATVQIMNLQDKEWTFLQDDMTGVPGTDSPGWSFVDMMAVDADPVDPRHIFASGRTGLYEYYDGKLTKYYYPGNSAIKTAIAGANHYSIAKALTFDDEGTLWVLQSMTEATALLKKEQGQDLVNVSPAQLTTLYDIYALPSLEQISQDSRGYLWFVNNHWITPSVYCYDPKTGQMVNSWMKLVNEDGTTYSDYQPYCTAEDLDGNVWIGTNQGPFMVEAANITTPDTYVMQVKVPRNDGTNYADYLLAGAATNCIAIDGGNRKWFGTRGQGLYLISADNMEEIYHFTTDNSPLLSNNIESLAYDGTTGELFIGTDVGLCSYLSEATTAAETLSSNDVYAFPNPVWSGYDGLITVRGLTLDADVKIVSTSGQLVAQGRSSGGTFIWNGRDSQGRRVASGIYMVVAATSDGGKGTVCKIAMVK